jgi:hypothetical protein
LTPSLNGLAGSTNYCLGSKESSAKSMSSLSVESSTRDSRVAPKANSITLSRTLIAIPLACLLCSSRACNGKTQHHPLSLFELAFGDNYYCRDRLPHPKTRHALCLLARVAGVHGVFLKANSVGVLRMLMVLPLACLLYRSRICVFARQPNDLPVMLEADLCVGRQLRHIARGSEADSRDWD